MGILDFLKKKKKEPKIPVENLDTGEKLSAKEAEMGKIALNQNEILSQIDTKNLPRTQRMALKLFQKLPRKKQEEIMRKAMNPQEIMRNKDKVLAQINEMVKSGQIDKNQAEMLKSQLGLK